ncbi:MAG: Xaa-Pro peptidase family protein [bacterium]
MLNVPTKEELEGRLKKLENKLNENVSNWDTAIIISKVNQYYFTGTMQDGLLILKKEGDYSYFVRRSYSRAIDESPLEYIYPMDGYKDILEKISENLGVCLIETETFTYGILERLKKYFKISEIKPIERFISNIRAIKSPYELSIIRESGFQHDYLLKEIVPTLLREGMSEADLAAEIYEKSIKLGYHGVSRFSMFQMDLGMGQIGFGENSLYPTSFDGPGGNVGMSPAVPFVGSRERKLKKGDLVFADIGYGINGYHTDKTTVYLFGGKVNEDIKHIQKRLIEIEKLTASLLKVGNIPSDIYNSVMSEIDESFLENFMGFGSRKVKFLGHGVGLHIDEMPVIANCFKEPLQENMVIALEPKKGIKGFGMIGVEDTYLVTNEGGLCLTGEGREIIEL